MNVDALWDPTVGTDGKHPLLLLQRQRKALSSSTRKHDLFVTNESLPFRSTHRTQHLVRVALLRSAWEQAAQAFTQWTQEERSKRVAVASIPDAFNVLKASPHIHLTLPRPRLMDLLVSLPKHAFLTLLDQHPRLDAVLAQPLFDSLFEARLVVDFSSRGRGGSRAKLGTSWRERYLRFASLHIIVPHRASAATTTTTQRTTQRTTQQPPDRHLRPRRIRRLRKQ